MEHSLIYDLLSNELYEYRKEIEQEENNFTKWIKEARGALEKSLNKEQIKLVDRYTHILTLREEDIEFQVETRILNLGVKIGMQLQQAFDEYDA